MIKEIEKLLAHSIEYASDLLTETGEAYPFGAFIDTIGNVHPLEMEVDMKNVPTNGKVIESLTAYCTNEIKENKMKGYALAYEVQLQLEDNAPAVDAIAFDMSHNEQNDIPLYYLPFTVNSNKKGTIGELFAVKRG